MVRKVRGFLRKNDGDSPIFDPIIVREWMGKNPEKDFPSFVQTILLESVYLCALDHLGLERLVGRFSLMRDNSSINIERVDVEEEEEEI